MHYFSSGSTSSTSNSVLLTANKAASASASARDGGAEFRTAMDDVAKTNNVSRPEPAARPERAERVDSRAAPAQHSKPARRSAAAQTREAESTKAEGADKTELASDAAASATETPVTEADKEKSALLAEAGLVGSIDATDLSDPQGSATGETPQTTDASLTALAPALTGAAPLAAGIILPPQATAAATLDAVVPGAPLLGSGNKATNSLAGGELNGLKTGAAELAESEAGMLDIEGEMSPDDFKQTFSRLLAANPAADKGAQQAEQSLTKLASEPTPMVSSATRPGETQAPQQRSFVVQTGVPTAMGQPRWGQAVGERVLWLAAQNVSSAELRLDPPELGPMQVRVSIHQDQATVSFSSPHPLVREALDQSATRLREMFSEQGLNLTDVDVSDQSFARQNAQDEASGGRSDGGSDADIEDENLIGVTTDLTRIRLVDHYA